MQLLELHKKHMLYFVKLDAKGAFEVGLTLPMVQTKDCTMNRLLLALGGILLLASALVAGRAASGEIGDTLPQADAVVVADAGAVDQDLADCSADIAQADDPEPEDPQSTESSPALEHPDLPMLQPAEVPPPSGCLDCHTNVDVLQEIGEEEVVVKLSEGKG